jgi:hypothetical protein
VVELVVLGLATPMVQQGLPQVVAVLVGKETEAVNQEVMVLTVKLLLLNYNQV